MSLEEVKCPLCGTNKFSSPLVKKGMLDIEISPVICKKCGLIQLSPRWNKKRYDQFYEKEYDTYFSRSGNSSTENKPYQLIASRLSSLISGSPSILDIGSGMGTGLKELGKQLKTKKLFSIEPSKKAKKFMRKKE